MSFSKTFNGIMVLVGFVLVIGSVGASDYAIEMGVYEPITAHISETIVGIVLIICGVIGLERRKVKVAGEKNFENRVKKYLKEQGCWSLKYWGGAAYTKSGIPDLLVCCGGRFLGIELKAVNGKPSDLQLYNLRRIQAAGGLGCLLYPKHWDLFKQMIEQIQAGKNIDTSEFPFLNEWK